ncbi:MAG: hypothetical protein WCK49_07910 [Myxococcaceae bacterium]
MIKYVLLTVVFLSVPSFSGEVTFRGDAYLCGASVQFLDYSHKRQTLSVLLGYIPYSVAATCSPTIAILQGINVLDSIEQFSTYFTGHEPLIAPYNPSTYLFGLIPWPKMNLMNFMTSEDAVWNSSFERGRKDSASVINFINGFCSVIHLVYVLRDWLDDYPVQTAIEERNYLKASALIQQGFDGFPPSFKGAPWNDIVNYGAHQAIQDENLNRGLEGLKAFLEISTEPNFLTDFCSSMADAFKNNNFEAAAILLKHGADLWPLSESVCPLSYLIYSEDLTKLCLDCNVHLEPRVFTWIMQARGRWLLNRDIFKLISVFPLDCVRAASRLESISPLMTLLNENRCNVPQKIFQEAFEQQLEYLDYWDKREQEKISSNNGYSRTRNFRETRLFHFKNIVTLLGERPVIIEKQDAEKLIILALRIDLELLSQLGKSGIDLNPILAQALTEIKEGQTEAGLELMKAAIKGGAIPTMLDMQGQSPDVQEYLSGYTGRPVRPEISWPIKTSP